MNTDELLRQLFLDHADLAPDADETLRNVHDRVERRSVVTRFGSRRRPFVVVATGIGVAATIVGIVATSVILKADDHRPGGPNQPATRTTKPVPSNPTSVGSRTGPTTAASVGYLTVAAEYLPNGKATEVLAENGLYGQLRNYVVTDGGTRTKVDLVSADSVAGLGSTSFTGPGTSVRVVGHAARQWAKPGLSRVVVTRADGVTAVDVDRPGMPSAAIAALTRKVAGGLRFDQHDVIKPEFRLGYVPAGSALVELAVDDQRATSWLVAKMAADGSTPLGANTQVYSTDAPPTLRGPTGRKVQGHPTRTGTDGGLPVVEIVAAVGHHTIVISGAPGASLSGLYRIGDGLIL